MLFTPYAPILNNVGNNDTCFAEPAIEKWVYLKIGAGYIQVKNVVYTCKEVHILFLPKMNGQDEFLQICFKILSIFQENLFLAVSF